MRLFCITSFPGFRSIVWKYHHKKFEANPSNVGEQQKALNIFFEPNTAQYRFFLHDTFKSIQIHDQNILSH